MSKCRPAFVSAISDLYGDRFGKPLVGDKTPDYAPNMPLLRGLWPQAKYVDLVRDGRDVCLSMLARKRAPGAAGRYYETRYEALVEDPDRECAAMYEFLGVPYDRATLDFHQSREKKEVALSAKSAWRPPTPGLRNWESELSSEDQQWFEAVAGDVLEEFGYACGVPRLLPKAIEHSARMRDCSTRRRCRGVSGRLDGVLVLPPERHS